MDCDQYDTLTLSGISFNRLLTISPNKWRELKFLGQKNFDTYRFPVDESSVLSSPNFKPLNNVSIGAAEKLYGPEKIIWRPSLWIIFFVSTLVWYGALSHKNIVLSRQFGSSLSNILTIFIKKRVITSPSVAAWPKLNHICPKLSKAAITDSLGYIGCRLTFPCPYFWAHTFLMKLVSLSQVSSILIILLCISISSISFIAYYYLKTKDLVVLVFGCSFLDFMKLRFKSLFNTNLTCFIFTCIPIYCCTAWHISFELTIGFFSLRYYWATSRIACSYRAC